MPLSRLWASGDVIWLIAIQLCILIISLFSTLCHSLSWLLSSNIGWTLLLSLVWMSSISLERVTSCLMPFPILLSQVALWMLIPPVYHGSSFLFDTRTYLACLRYTRGKTLTPPWFPCYRRLLLVMLSLFLHCTWIIFIVLLSKTGYLLTCYSCWCWFTRAVTSGVSL